MKPSRKSVRAGAAGVLVGALLVTASGAIALSGGRQNAGVLRLNGGESLSMSCAGPALSWSQTDGRDGMASCTPNDTTSTTVPATTTTTEPATTTTTEAPTTTTTVPGTTTTVPTSGSGGCALAQVAFCATDFTPIVNPANSRAGELDGTLWGTSIGTGAAGDGVADVTGACSSDTEAYPSNVQVCDGQIAETTNDAGGVSSLAMYPRQPFNFAGRTGNIVFDVSNNSQGSHAAWPELWLTSTPTPDPFAHEASWESLPQNGFGLRFNGCTDSSGAQATCSQGDGAVGVQSAITVDNYVENDSANGGNLDVIGSGSVIESQPGQMNHYQVQVAQNQITVYGTNAYSGPLNLTRTPLIRIATIPVDLDFTQGLVWLEDAHYNGDKFNTQRINTFDWNNLGFDGPILPRDLGFDVPANTTPATNLGGIAGLNGEYTAYTVWNGSENLTVPGVTAADLSAATGALLTFNFYGENEATGFAINAKVNGNQVGIPWPYPTAIGGSPQTIALPVPLSDITPGTNTLTFTAPNYGLDVMNIDLILQGAGGTVNP